MIKELFYYMDYREQGKTTYLRYLIGRLKKKGFILITDSGG